MSQDNRRDDFPSESSSRAAASISTRPPAQVPAASTRNNAGDGRNSSNNNGRKPPKRGRFWRGLGLTTLLVAAGGAAYGVFTKDGREKAQAVRDGFQAVAAVKQNPNLLFDEASSDHVNILLIGRDVNYKPGKVYDPRTKTYRPYHVVDKDTPARADSMIIMSLDKTRGTVRMLSVPRDSMVRMPPNEYHVKRAKLNAAHAYGGPPLLIKTFHDALGITIHKYAVIKFDGFKKLIDEVGGVEVNVEGALLRNKETGKLYRGDLNYDDNWGNLHQHLKPGRQTLNGQQAHDYVRFREDIEGDTGRMRRQQQVMRALAKKIMHSSIFALPKLTKELRQQFETDMTDNQLASAAYFMHGLGDAAKIQPVTLFGIFSERGSFVLNRPKNTKLLQTVLGPTFDAAQFLADSPSTDEDEVKSANDSNPGAQEVLREAGLLKGKIDPKLAANADDMSPQGRTDSNSATSSARSDATAVSTEGATGNSTETSPSNKGASDRRVVIASTETNGNATNEPTPRRRRRHRRAVSEETSPDSPREATTREATATRVRHRRSSQSTDLPADSPIPAPESSSSDSSGDSPIPQAE